MANKKATKSVDVVSALKAFETTLRAASRHKGVAVHKPLIEQLQQCQEASKPLVHVVLSSPGVHSEQVAAVTDCLASYPAVKSLSCLGCNVGDKGLEVISALLQASGSRWWRGCRLTTLEVTSDSTAACLSPSTAAHEAAGAVQPSSACSRQRQWGSRDCLRENQRPSTAPPAGICPVLPGYLQLPNSQQHAQDDIRLGSLRPVHYRLHAPGGLRTMMEVRAWALAPTLRGAHLQHSAPTSPQGGANTQPDPDGCCFRASSLQQFALSLGVCGLQLQRLVLDHTVLGDLGISSLATGLANCNSLKVLSLCCCGIGPAGAKALAEALVPAHKHHCGAGSYTSSISSTPQVGGSRMSMASGNPSLAAPTLPTSCAASHGALGGSAVQEAAGQASNSSSSSQGTKPSLVELHLSGNPLGAAGLHAVSTAVKVMATLQVLGLADVRLDPASQACQLEVQVLAHSLLSGPNELTTLDFSDNLIGDECAMFFVGLLKAKPSVILLKLTPRLSTGVMQQLSGLMEEHQRAAKTLCAAKKGRKSGRT